MRGKDRAALRAQAHHLSPTVHIGAQGVSAAVISSLEDALRTRELVKIKLGKGADASAREAATDLAKRVGADVIQVIGRTITLFRKLPDRGDA